MAVRPFVISLHPEQLDWVKKVSKELKASRAEVVRQLIEEARAVNPTEFKAKLEKSKIQSMLTDIERRQAEHEKAKAALEARLSKLA